MGLFCSEVHGMTAHGMVGNGVISVTHVDSVEEGSIVHEFGEKHIK